MLENLYSLIKDCGFERTYWLAFSGGLDSRVLLDLCVKLRQRTPFSLRAIHVHHGLSPQADQWTAFCEQTCAALEVPFVAYRIEAWPPEGESLEAYARKQRYAVLERVLKPDEVLLTAHHQDDQAETVLLHLLRGSGPKGLSAMPKLKPRGLGAHLRPLLQWKRSELQVYAEQEQLLWIEDELNLNPRYPRNFIRHAIVPLLKKRWPSMSQTLARSAEHCAEAQDLLAYFGTQDLAQVSGAKTGTISVKRLLELSPARQRLVLRTWFESQNILLPSALKLGQIQEKVLRARWDSKPCVAWGQVELRRHQDELYLLSALKPHDSAQVYTWHLNEPLLISGLGRLQASPVLGQGLRTAIKTVEVRFRQGGEVYQLSSGRHHELKKFFQEQGVPPWERDRLPLCWVDNELAAIPGYLLVDRFKANPGERGYKVGLELLQVDT